MRGASAEASGRRFVAEATILSEADWQLSARLRQAGSPWLAEPDGRLRAHPGHWKLASNISKADFTLRTGLDFGITALDEKTVADEILPR